MAKKTDFPHELRHFVGVLNSFRGHFYDYDIFRDFIDYVTASLLWSGDKAVADDLQKRYGDDYARFNDLFLSLLTTMDEQLKLAAWYDALGTLYENIASRNKCSWMGQFFTPASVCDFMAQIQAPEATEDRPVTGLLVNDPACGSGRTLLSFNAIRPGNYIVAQDLDPICTKMAAINMALHGVKGQAVNGNSLDPDDYRFGYEVNPRLYTLQGCPHLLPITREQSVAWRIWQKHMEQLSNPEPAEPPAQVITLPKSDEFAPNLAGLPATQIKLF